MSGETRDVWAAGPAPDRVLEVDLRAAALPLPHPDDAFDAIVCVEPIATLSEPETLLDELARVLAPGGVLVVTGPPADAVRARFGELRQLSRLAGLVAERAALQERLAEAEALGARVLELEAELDEARWQRDDARRRLDTSNQIIDDVISSPSWRMTAPVRAIKGRIDARRR
jgi:SAM-dependent methyltransferase